MSNLWDKEIKLSKADIERMIEVRFSELSPAHASQVAEGWDNTVYRVNQHFVFRVPRRMVAIPLLRTETEVLSALAKHLPEDIPVPLYVSEFPHGESSIPLVGYRWLEGLPAHQVQLTNTERTAIGIQFASFLRALHDVPLSTPCLGVAEHKGAQTLEDALRGDSLKKLDVTFRANQFIEYVEKLRAQGEIGSTTSYLRILEDASGCASVATTLCVVHGDLNFRNFLLDRGRLSAIIDWGDVHLGHPAVDLAVLHTFLPPRARDAFLQHYGPVNPSTWVLARFRALYTAMYLLLYALDIGDTSQAEEARRTIERILM